jgi:enterochelin esterase-like enzyme
MYLINKNKFLILLLIFSSNILNSQSFEDFLNIINNSPDSLKSTIIDSFIVSTPEFPLIEHDTLVHFIYRDNALNISIAGDATGWETGIYNMQNLDNTNFWYHSHVFEADARLDYKFVIDGNSWILDPLNPHTVPSGFGLNSELRMPQWEFPVEISYYPDIAHGSLEDTVFYSINLGNSRQVRIYLPPSYYYTNENYNMILFHDGLEYISLAKADNIIDYMIHNHQLNPIIGIFIPPVERTREYGGDLQDEFSAFIVEEVLPWIDSRYRTNQTAISRAMAGASYGGNISLWIGVNHPDVFSHISAQSSYVQSSIFDIFQNSSFLNLDVYIDIGTYDIPLLIPMVFNLDEILTEESYMHQFQVFHEGHSWGNWRSNIDTYLQQFYPYNENYCIDLYGNESFLDECGLCVNGSSGYLPGENIDECGVCFGMNDCMGCTDPSAINFNPYATIDDGSCIYPQIVQVYFGAIDYAGGSVEIMMNNPGPESCWGFQFNISGLDLVDAYGGSSQEYGIFPLAVGENGSILGFNFGQSSIPPGNELLTILQFDNITSDTSCFSQATISGPLEFGSLDVELGECLLHEDGLTGCTDPVAINYLPNAFFDDGSCLYGLLGDINQDNLVDIIDVVMLVDIILFTTPSPYQFWASNMNEDSVIDILDIIIMISVILNDTMEMEKIW